MKNIVKILTALATVAGIIYIVATYGEQIVAWCKKTLASFPKCPCCEKEEAAEEAAPAEEAAEEVAAEEPAAEEVPVEEAVVSEDEPVAAEEDFAE